MDAILQDGIRAATHLIELRGEFFPFAVIMTNHGEIHHVQALLDNPQPKSDAVIESLMSSLKKIVDSGGCVAVAMVSNVFLRDRTTGSSSDAISVEIDDIESAPVTCYIPYDVIPGGIELGELQATEGRRLVFLV
jgi:hypothetical protein